MLDTSHSGCSTFLKTVAGETHGLFLDGDVDLQYQGISFPEMQGKFKGEVIYQGKFFQTCFRVARKSQNLWDTV